MTPMITFRSPNDKLPKRLSYPLSRSDIAAAVEGRALIVLLDVTEKSPENCGARSGM